MKYLNPDYIKEKNKFKLVKTIDCSNDQNEIAKLVELAKVEKSQLEFQESMFIFEKGSMLFEYFSNISNNQIKTIGPELVLAQTNYPNKY